jgi:hypothetical protein
LVIQRLVAEGPQIVARSRFFEHAVIERHVGRHAHDGPHADVQTCPAPVIQMPRE